MTPSQAQRMIDLASDLVPQGIYAISKGDYIEMRNDHLDPAEVLEKAREYEEHGFEVFYN